jgi:hypothetical protein
MKTKNTLAGHKDKACVQVSLDLHGLVSIGGHQIQEKDLRSRIIDKIPGAQFHKIVMAIKADLDKENA